MGVDCDDDGRQNDGQCGGIVDPFNNPTNDPGFKSLLEGITSARVSCPEHTKYAQRDSTETKTPESPNTECRVPYTKQSPGKKTQDSHR